MNLLYEFGRAGIRWCVNNSTSTTARGTSFNCIEATLVLEDGSTFSGRFGLHSDAAPEQMFAALLRKHAPRHPLTLTWLKDRGARPARLVTGALDELGACIHTALRKQAHSKQSVITWNAIHWLHPHDWSTLLARLREALSVFMAEKPRTWAQAGLKMKKVVLEVLDELECTAPLDAKGRETRRNELQTFALRSFLAACHLTERDEWVYGWTAYLLKDVDEALGPEEQEEPAAPAAA